MKKTNKNGFSVLEIILAIAIVGLLATVAYFAYQAVQKSDQLAAVDEIAVATAKTNAATALANAKSVELIVEAYYADNDVYPTLAQLKGYKPSTALLESGVTINSNQLTAAQNNGQTIQYLPKIFNAKKPPGGGCVGYWDGSLDTPGAVYLYFDDDTKAGNTATPTCLLFGYAE